MQETVFEDNMNDVKIIKRDYGDMLTYVMSYKELGTRYERKISYSKEKGWEFSVYDIRNLQFASIKAYEFVTKLPGLKEELDLAKRLKVANWMGEEKKAALGRFKENKNLGSAVLYTDNEHNIQLSSKGDDKGVSYTVSTIVHGGYNEIKINTGFSFSKENGWEFNLSNLFLIKQNSPEIFNYMMQLPGLKEEFELAASYNVLNWYGFEKQSALAYIKGLDTVSSNKER